MIEFECECGKVLKVDKRMAGRLSRCPACASTIRIPGRDRPVDPAPPQASPPQPASEPATSASGMVELMVPPAEAQANQAAPAAAPSKLNVPQESPDTGWAGGDELAALASASASTLHAELPETNRMPARKKNALNVGALLCGVFMVSTFLLPWLVVGERVGMSWDLVQHAPATVSVFLVTSWMIGLAAIILACVLRGFPAAICEASLGLLGAVLLLTAFTGSYTSRDMPGFGRTFGAINVLAVVFLVGLIIVTNVRLRLGANLAIRVIQGVTAGAYAVLALVAFFISFSNWGDLPDFLREKLVGDRVYFVFTDLAAIGGAIVALVHAAAMNVKEDTLSKVAIGLVYSSLVAVACYFIVRPAILAEQSGLILLFLNIFLLVGSIGFLFCSGVIRSICEFAAMTAGPTQTPKKAAAAPASDGRKVQERLSELASLRDQGLISEQEYAVKQSRILDEL